MSETATFKGKLQLLATGIPASESYSREFLHAIKKDYELPDYYKGYTELLVDDFGFVLYKESLYKVVTKTDIQHDDIFEITDKGNGEYEYIVQYYDGGCSFNEAIGYALAQMNKPTI